MFLLYSLKSLKSRAHASRKLHEWALIDDLGLHTYTNDNNVKLLASSVVYDLLSAE